MTDWTPGTWWRAPPEERFRAYYMCMRVHYGMPASEALAYARANYADVANIIGDIRKAVTRKAPAEILAERSPAWRDLLTGRRRET